MERNKQKFIVGITRIILLIIIGITIAKVTMKITNNMSKKKYIHIDIPKT